MPKVHRNMSWLTHIISPPPCDSPLVQMTGGSFPASDGGTAGLTSPGSTPGHAPTVTSGGTTGGRVIPTAHGKNTDKTFNGQRKIMYIIH